MPSIYLTHDLADTIVCYGFLAMSFKCWVCLDIYRLCLLLLTLLKCDNSTGGFQVLSNDNSSFGYNAATGVYEDLMAAGIIDPTKVCILYLQFVIVLISSRTINTLLQFFTLLILFMFHGGIDCEVVKHLTCIS
jgi:hypothetical protein